MSYHARLKQLVAEKKFNEGHECELSERPKPSPDVVSTPFGSSVSSGMGIYAEKISANDFKHGVFDKSLVMGKSDPPNVMDREVRRARVLAMLIDNPDSHLEVYIDDLSDHENVILMVAIRDYYSFEMLIFRSKYDRQRTLDFIDTHRKNEVTRLSMVK